MQTTTDVGRLALRVEGEFWNAYWAPHQDSMSGAIMIASIRMDFVGMDSKEGRKLKDDFMNLTRNAFGTMIKEITGQTARWRAPQPAPENERSSNG